MLDKQHLVDDYYIISQNCPGVFTLLYNYDIPLSPIPPCQSFIFSLIKRRVISYTLMYNVSVHLKLFNFVLYLSILKVPLV